ncbi:adenylosuccinate lyase [Apiospora marii]|uniref:Adenylosuccinate lyase n=1 Tax=Apiospora marii TaxID=335849 RepID=A0ABR1RFL2_9PEZI
MASHDTYQTPLPSRYASPEMSRLFSDRNRHSTWRKLWLRLAESQRELGIETITPEALEQMKSHLEVTDEDYEVARVEEKRRRHDAMAHVHAFGAVAPAAAGLMHYGATSCFVTDNTELILMRDALDLLTKKLAKVISNLSAFALKWKALANAKVTGEPTLGYTHLQEAQLVTVGKRAAHWAQDLMLDLHSIEQVRRDLRFRGAQGTTGTQASFLEIFQGDSAKCDKLNELLCAKFGFPACYDLSSQTYTRKVDVIVANAVTGIGTSAQKIAGDIRLLAGWKEIEEPFEASQIGSSAMAYKRNPANALRENLRPGGRLNIQAGYSCHYPCKPTVRRTNIPEMMLLADAICRGLDNVTSGLVVYPQLIAARVQSTLPFMIAESVLMKLCAKGVSRQEAHEQVRVLSHEAASVVKNEGKPNDLISRIKGSDFFQPIWDDLDGMLKAELYIGRSVELVDAYCGPGGPVEKALAPYMACIESSSTAELDV